jgi:hypothetical protein
MSSEKCHFCKVNPGTLHYVLGAIRCVECAETFNAKNRAERLKRENEIHKCGECGESFQGIYDCPHCCSHDFDPDEGYHCLNCGTDGAEEVLSRIYDEAKDRRKYGDS